MTNDDFMPSRMQPLPPEEHWKPEDLEKGMRSTWTNWKSLNKVPPQPDYDAELHGPIAASPLERLRQLGDAQYEILYWREEVRA